jgi:hypothetical protein
MKKPGFPGRWSSSFSINERKREIAIKYFNTERTEKIEDC